MVLRFVPGFWSSDGTHDDAPFAVAVAPTPVSSPRLLAWNEPLADALGLNAAERERFVDTLLTLKANLLRGQASAAPERAARRRAA